MDLIPAIDIFEGKVVRLKQGDYDAVTTYGDDPVAQAQRFYDQGALRIHVVDLDGARSGQPSNLRVVEKIVKAVPIAVQVGGGIRSQEVASHWLDAGAKRIVLGTVAIKNPQLAQTLCATHKGSIVISLDAKEGRLALEGWREQTPITVQQAALNAEQWGATALLYTDIARDGMEQGPNIESTVALQSEVSMTVIASGGIGTLDDLRNLKRAGIRAAVCGRALYAGRFSLPEALTALNTMDKSES